jgi:uncharacterized protein (TIGR02266 family)
MLASSIPPPRHAPHAGPFLEQKSRSERRGARRLPLSAAVDLTSRDNFFAGRALDISLGGIFIETSVALDVGTKIGVRIQILDRAFVVATEVAWVLWDRVGRPVGVGVRFLHMPAPLVETIHAFMQQRMPIGFDVDES